MPSEIWFESDLHLGHGNINLPTHADRGFYDLAQIVPTYREETKEWENVPIYKADVEAMNEAIITRWNETVAPGDTVYVPGDVAMGKLTETIPLASLLHGNKILICGNHDKPWFGGKTKGRAASFKLYHDAGFTIVANSHDEGHGILALDDLFGGRRVDVCHFPFKCEETQRHQGKYSAYYPDDRGQWLIHGHTHRKNKKHGRMIHIGADAWDLTPVHVDQVRALMDLGEFIDVCPGCGSPSCENGATLDPQEAVS